MPAVVLVAIFLAAAVAIWVAGIQLSNATDALDARLGLGSAVGGLVLLAIATNLPEIAITVTAAASGNVQLAVGNLVGGIAIQTLVLAALDIRSKGRPITHRVGSLVVVLEASIVLATLVAAMMTTQLPRHVEVAGISPGSLASRCSGSAAWWWSTGRRRGSRGRSRRLGPLQAAAAPTAPTAPTRSPSRATAPRRLARSSRSPRW
jgi:hypothetical protein